MGLSNDIRTLQFSLLKRFGFKVVHFIHIGKTAGSVLKECIKEKKFIWGNTSIMGKYIFQMEYHTFTLKKLKEDEFFFFIIRDPISRYVSGFYSRLRMGQPKLYTPWSEGEKIAFAKFGTPNDLGESLSAVDPILRGEAEQAMKSIGHVNSSYWDWFGSEEHILKRKKSLLFYLRQENLDSDLKDVGQKLGFSFPPLHRDEVKSHKTPEHFDKKLSELAILNLKTWYRRDYEFIEFLNSLPDNVIPQKQIYIES